MPRIKSWDLAPPAIAFACASMVLWGAAIAAGVGFFKVSSYMRWDSSLYLQFSTSGYHLFQCTSGYPAGSWCGNAGWFPGYSLLLALLFGIGLPHEATAVVVSWLFDFGMVVVLWRGFLSELDSPLRYLALGFAAVAPGGVYLRAAFPMSMAAFFLVFCLLCLHRRRWGWAGIAAGVSTLCYPTAVVLVPVVAVWVFAEEPGPLARRLRIAAVPAVLACTGFVATCVIMQIQTGHWNAYFLTQQKYGHGLHFPLTQVWPDIRGFFSGQTGVGGAQDAEVTLGLVVTLVLTVNLAIRAYFRTATHWDALIVAVVLLFWIFPATQADTSLWRTDSQLAVAALGLTRMRAPVATLLTGAAVAVFPLLAFFFFQGTLV